MIVVCKNVSKRFGREWIFRDFDFTFLDKHIYAITGPNGSGKSTLLKTIATFEAFHKGSIAYQDPEKQLIEKEAVLLRSSYVAPYQSLIEELSLAEMLNFHDAMLGSPVDRSFIEELGLSQAMQKPISNFSSGMKQRLKLGLAFYSGRETVFLDEPTMNLDKVGIAWYQSLLARTKGYKTVFIASNDAFEYQLADQVISILDYKQKH